MHTDGTNNGQSSTGEEQAQPGEVISTTTPTGQPAGGDDRQTFTQADLDRIAGRTRKEALAKFAKEHGLEDPKELENLIKANQEANDKARTDLQKAQDEAARIKQQLAEVETRMFQTLLRAEFRVKAADKVSDVDLAYLAAQDAKLLSDEAGLIEVDTERGVVEGMDKVIEKLVKDKPILKKASQAQAGGTGGSAGGGAAGVTAATIQAIEAEIKRRFGIN